MSAAAASFGTSRNLPDDMRPDDSKAAQQRAHEPSMEEILASIRRIIADDSALPKIRKLAEPATPLPPEPLVVEAPPLPLVARGDDVPAFVTQLAEPETQTSLGATILDESAAYLEPPHHPLQPISHAASDAHVAAPSLQKLEAEPVEDIFDLAGPAAEIDDYAFLGTPTVPELVHVVAPALPEWHMPAAAEPALAAVETGPQGLTSAGTDAAVAASFQSLAQTVLLNNHAMVEQMTREMLRPMLKTWLDDNLPVMVERLVRTEIERVARGGR